MNRFVRGALATAVAAQTAAAADFQGRAEYRITGSSDVKGTATAIVGDGGARFELDVASPQAAQAGIPRVKLTTLVRAGDKDHVYVLHDAEHTYSVIDAGRGDTDRWKITRLGATTIAGYPCERVRLESEGGQPDEVCVSTTLGRVPAWATSDRSDQGVPTALARAGLDGLPLRWAHAGDQSGAVLEVVKVTPGAEPSSAFEIPAGYQRQDSAMASPEMRARLQEEMKKLSPEQRKRLGALLRGSGSGASP